MTQIVVPINEIEPTALSLRLPLGVAFQSTLAFRTPGNEPVDPTSLQPLLVLLPRSQGGTRSYEVSTYDAVNGVGLVAIPAGDLQDRSGYNLELYFRDGDPPQPTTLAAQGDVIMQGLAFGTDTSFGGPLGPQGPAGG